MISGEGGPAVGLGSGGGLGFGGIGIGVGFGGEGEIKEGKRGRGGDIRLSRIQMGRFGR